MKKTLLSLSASLLVMVVMAQSKYNQREAFDPQFYPQTGNEFRSASGAPGPKYWQNRADYNIRCTLDTGAQKVSGEVEITYTNNSPDNLNFLWLQLDQNIYQPASRGSATTTQTGGRWANAAFTQGDMIKSIAVDADGKKYTPRFSVSDTRLQVWLQEALKAAGEKVKLVITYEFTVP